MEPFYDEDGIRIYCGDCREILPKLGEQFETCITDPPYELGFMGREWDKAGVSFDPKTWKAVYDALKPGAMLLSFGGTRTFHRIAVAIEDAGFLIRDCLSWLYGCLSEDTELLVNGKWVRYQDISLGSYTLCYDTDRKEFQWMPIERVFVYDYDDTAFRVYSDYTDQIVSRNHRLVVEREGSFVFQVAEEAAFQCEVRIPVLQGLRMLLDDLSVCNMETGISKQVLQSFLRESGSKAAKKAYVREVHDENFLCGVRKGEMGSECLAETYQKPHLLTAMQRSSSGCGVGQTCIQREGRVDGGISEVVSGEDVRCEQSGVERRCNVFQEERELQVDQIRQVPGGVSRDGSEGWVCYGASPNCSPSVGSFPEAIRSCSSYQPQSARQQVVESGAFFFQPGAQAVRASRYTRTDVARIKPFHYRGVVWCVKVPTGAFVARRNGKVFITGNSGFPKSLDISKDIDRKLGKKRKKIRIDAKVVRNPKATTGGAAGTGKERGENPWIQRARKAGYHEKGGPDPVSDEGKLWSGFGTMLKPSWEAVILAMRPNDGSFAENALKHGVAGINVGEAKKLMEEERWPPNVTMDEMVAQAIEKAHGASRYFYVAKASPLDRGRYKLDAMPLFGEKEEKEENMHPTVKPVELMKYLVILTKMPTGGVGVDPFMGSGSTLLAAKMLKRRFVGIEMNREWCKVAVRRLERMKGM